jgi:hypothetical protein
VAQDVGPEFKSQYHKKKKVDLGAWVKWWSTCLLSSNPNTSKRKRKKPTKTQRKQVNHFSAGCIRGQLSSPPMPKAYWFRAKRVGVRSGVGVAEDGKMLAGEARRAHRVEPEDLHHRDSAWL